MTDTPPMKAPKSNSPKTQHFGSFPTHLDRQEQGLTPKLPHIAANEVANRPGRIEPRVLKRRRHRYPLMQRPREQLRAKLRKT
jgi:hypothetical protein